MTIILTITTKTSSIPALMEVNVAKASHIPDYLIRKITTDLVWEKISWTTPNRTYVINRDYKNGKFNG